jgi:hypothetical protein
MIKKAQLCSTKVGNFCFPFIYIVAIWCFLLFFSIFAVANQNDYDYETTFHFTDGVGSGG